MLIGVFVFFPSEFRKEILYFLLYALYTLTPSSLTFDIKADQLSHWWDPKRRGHKMVKVEEYSFWIGIDACISKENIYDKTITFWFIKLWILEGSYASLYQWSLWWLLEFYCILVGVIWWWLMIRRLKFLNQ